MGNKFPLKIAFIGAHGTGKTQLVYQLAGELIKNSYNVEVITEVARQIEKEGMPMNENTTIEAQACVLHKQMIEELIASNKIDKKKGIVICDRSVIDNFIYMYSAHWRNNSFCSEEMMIHYNSLVKFWMNNQGYNFLFKVPIIQEKIENDGMRSTSKEFQMGIDERLCGFLSSNKKYIRYYNLPAENVSAGREEWIVFIKHILKQDAGLELKL